MDFFDLNVLHYTWMANYLFSSVLHKKNKNSHLDNKCLLIDHTLDNQDLLRLKKDQTRAVSVQESSVNTQH